MYITVNGSTYQNAERVKTAQSVCFTADGLADIGTVEGVIKRYRNDGFEIGEDAAGNYLRQETLPGGFRLTNVLLPEPVVPTAEAVRYDEMTSTMNAVRLMMAAGSIPVTTDEAKITVSGLYEGWTAGSHTVGEIYNAGGQTWECYQAYDNAVYPDITPGNSAWYTFNRPLHGKSRETARDFVQPTGSHDIYKAGEWMIFTAKYYRCKQDTAHSPADYAAAWENLGTDGAETESPGAEETIPDFVQPTGAHDAYNTGDKVKSDGKVYESTMDNNVYSPSAYPAGWKEIEG